MAAATIMLKLTGPNGDILGESVEDRYEGHIKLEDWKWSLDASADTLKPSEFNFSKYADIATVPMLNVMTATGQGKKDQSLCPKAVIVIEEDSWQSTFEVRITLTNVQITGFRLVAKLDEKGGALEEDWTFKYSNIRIDYTSYGTLEERGKTVPFEIDSNLKGMRAPSGGAEEKILQLVPQVESKRLDTLIDKMREAVKASAKQPPVAKTDEMAARKTTRLPPGAA